MLSLWVNGWLVQVVVVFMFSWEQRRIHSGQRKELDSIQPIVNPTATLVKEAATLKM